MSSPLLFLRSRQSYCHLLPVIMLSFLPQLFHIGRTPLLPHPYLRGEISLIPERITTVNGETNTGHLHRHLPKDDKTSTGLKLKCEKRKMNQVNMLKMKTLIIYLLYSSRNKGKIYIPKLIRSDRGRDPRAFFGVQGHISDWSVFKGNCAIIVHVGHGVFAPVILERNFFLAFQRFLVVELINPVLEVLAESCKVKTTLNNLSFFIIKT